MAEVLSHLALFGEENRVGRILDVVDEVIRLTSIKKKCNEWHVARLNGEIVRQARDMCKLTCVEDDDTFQSIIVARDEYIPQLEGLLDNVLHNYILG